MAESYYEIWQILDTAATRDLLYRPYSYLRSNRIRVAADNYTAVFRETLTGTETVREIRETLEGKENGSGLEREVLRISDVIAVTKDGITFAYYVDPTRLILIPDFFRKPTSAALITLDTKGYAIDGRRGSWVTVDSLMIDGNMYYLMLSETYKRDAPYVIVDDKGTVLGTDTKGFTDESIAMIRDAVRQAEIRKGIELSLIESTKPKLENWQKHYENGEYLRSAEITEEQNYNMIDGSINNKASDKGGQRRSVLERLSEKKDAVEPNVSPSSPPNRSMQDYIDEPQRTRK